MPCNGEILKQILKLVNSFYILSIQCRAKMEYPDGPDHFSDIHWPQPKLLDNRPQGPDEALVWYMNYYQNLIRHFAPNRFVGTELRSFKKMYIGF